MNISNYIIKIEPCKASKKRYIPFAASESEIPLHQAEVYTVYAEGVRNAYQSMVEQLKKLVADLEAVEDPLFMNTMPPANILMSHDFWATRTNFQKDLYDCDEKHRLQQEKQRLQQQHLQQQLQQHQQSVSSDSKSAALWNMLKEESAANPELAKLPLANISPSVAKENKRFISIKKAAEGGWTTLLDGRCVMLWAFHAFEPPVHCWEIAQPLVHLGLYNPITRSLDSSESAPQLPTTQEYWPWGSH